jgi:hypothetical protein
MQNTAKNFDFPMYRSLCKTAQAAFLLFLLISDFKEN